jgi:hypothetical protein
MGMGDVKVSEARAYEGLHRLILKACADAFEIAANRANCSGFVKDVGNRLGISIGGTGVGQANDIYSEIDGAPWYLLGHGAPAAVKAAYWARQSYFVVAAWKHPDGHNGHVAVVTDLRDLQQRVAALTDRNVAASWGVLNREDLAQDNGPIRESFGTLKRPNVKYAARFINKFS